jgi:hypothetical protein
MATPPSFIPGIGRLTTGRFAFQDHLEGKTPPESSTSFRHTADQIDMSPPVIGGATTVQSSLANIASFITSQAGAGQGFITVGTGYDTYVNANGTYNYDPSIPSLDTVLNPILAAILAYQTSYTPVPAAYERIRDGGIILIPAGTYTVKNTIQVPPGITILGEGFGTKIVNGTGLNLAQQSPSLSGTPAPVFKILPDPNRASDDAAVDTNLFIFMRETRICNLVLCDNFVEPTMLGDTNYRAAQNTSATTPLIQQENGSNLFLDQVYAAGRTAGGYTSSLILLDTSSPAPSGTILKMDGCFLDGFSVPIQWLSTGNTSTPVNADFLSITNSKIRGYGYLNGDGSDGYANSIVVMNDNNANIADNYIYGDANNITSFVYMLNHLPTTPQFGARSKVIVQSNNIEINRSSNSLNSSFSVLGINSTNFGGNFANYCSAVASNNNFQDTFDIAVDGDSFAALTSTSNAVPSTLSIGFSTIASNGITLAPSGASASVDISPTDEINMTPTVNISPGGSSPNQGVVFIQGNDATHGIELTSTGPIALVGNTVELGGFTSEVLILGTLFAADATAATLSATGAVSLQPSVPGVNTTGVLSVYPIQGTSNTQHMIGGRYLAVVSTTASGSNVVAITIPLPINSIGFIEVCWARKDTTSLIGPFGNKAAVNASNIGGDIGWGTLTTYVAAGGTFDAASKVSIGASSGNITITAVAQTDACDWQFIADVNIN